MNIFEQASSITDGSSNSNSAAIFNFGITTCKYKGISLSEGNATISPSIVLTFVDVNDDKMTHDYRIWPPFARPSDTDAQNQKAMTTFFETALMLLNRFEEKLDANGSYNAMPKFIAALKEAGCPEDISDARHEPKLFMEPAFEAMEKVISQSPFLNAEFEMKVLASVYNDKKRLGTPSAAKMANGNVYTHFRRNGELVLTDPLKISAKENANYQIYRDHKETSVPSAGELAPSKEEDLF